MLALSSSVVANSPSRMCVNHKISDLNRLNYRYLFHWFLNTKKHGTCGNGELGL